eukprot:122112-Chlamydomonas_euryale.AAC.2
MQPFPSHPTHSSTRSPYPPAFPPGRHGAVAVASTLGAALLQRAAAGRARGGPRLRAPAMLRLHRRRAAAPRRGGTGSLRRRRVALRRGHGCVPDVGYRRQLPGRSWGAEGAEGGVCKPGACVPGGGIREDKGEQRDERADEHEEVILVVAAQVAAQGVAKELRGTIY